MVFRSLWGCCWNGSPIEGWKRHKSRSEKSKSKKKKISRNIKKRVKKVKCAASHDASSPLGANGYKNHPESSEETERSKSGLQNDVHMQSCVQKSAWKRHVFACSLPFPYFPPPTTIHYTSTVSRLSFVGDMLQMTRITTQGILSCSISTRSRSYHVFHFRAAVFFTMFPPRVKRMPSTITYLHFFVVNRDNELVAPNKTWAIESSADRPAIISAPESNDGNGNKRRERAAWCLLAKFHGAVFQRKWRDRCNFVRGGGGIF
jgi:hypothetical protein